MQKYKEIILYTALVLLGLIYALVNIKPVALDLYHIEKDIKSKTVESADLERKLEALKASEIEKMSVSGIAKNIYKPNESGMDTEGEFSTPFDDIIDMAKYNSIKIYSVQYAYNPPDDDFVKGAPDKYNVCQVTMELIADYSDFESFLKELLKYPYLLNIEKIELVPYTKNKKILLINMQIKLYAAK